MGIAVQGTTKLPGDLQEIPQDELFADRFHAFAVYSSGEIPASRHRGDAHARANRPSGSRKETAETLQPFNVLPLTITSVLVDNGVLVANGLVGDNPFSAPINLSLAPQQPANAECPVLDLEIGAIHLNLLGLNVDTSDICLEITAHRGALLGDLLCYIGNLLQGGSPLSDILNGLTGDQRTILNDGFTQLLNRHWLPSFHPRHWPVRRATSSTWHSGRSI